MIASLLVACVSTDNAVALQFDGIASAAWDGRDGLIATWQAASGDDVAYALDIQDADGVLAAHVDTADLTATQTRLPDGDYDLRVTAREASGDQTDGARTLRQHVGADRLELVGELPFNGGGRTLEGEGNLIAVGGGQQDGDGVMLVDISGEEPVEVATIAGLGEVTDLELVGDVLIVATDTGLHPDVTVSVRLFDVSDPADPTLVGQIAAAADNAHTLTSSGAHLYLASTLHQWVAIYDISDPSAPTRIATWAPPPPAGIHDMTVENGTMYVAYTLGMAIVDVSDPATPTLLSILAADWPEPFVHNLWPTADKTTLAMSEEVVGGGLRVYDIRDPSELSLTSFWRTEATHSIHNVVVRDTLAYCAWYVDGVIVLDIADPENPTVVGQYDSYTTGSEAAEDRGDGSQWPNVNGATHVWPFGSKLAVSDSWRGLMLFDFTPTLVTAESP